MIEYFVVQLITIGFEKQYEKYKNLTIHRRSFIIIFVSTFILFFYLTLSFAKYLRENFSKYTDEDNSKKGKKEIISQISNDILNGTHGIFVFNGVFSLIFSSFYLASISNEVKSFFFEDNLNYIFIPILMNKFYYFTLNYYCLYTSEETKKFEIISGSSLISFYILIWNVAMLILKSIIPDEKVDYDYNYFNIFYIIQLRFACIPSFL